MCYLPFDRSIGLWIINEFLKHRLSTTLFIYPRDKKGYEKLGALAVLPSPTRPMHFGSRDPSHQRNALTEKTWEKRRTGTKQGIKQGKPYILNWLRDCAIIIRRKGWIEPYIEQYYVVPLLTKAGKLLTPLLVTKKIITNPSIDLHEFTRFVL